MSEEAMRAELLSHLRTMAEYFDASLFVREGVFGNAARSARAIIESQAQEIEALRAQVQDQALHLISAHAQAEEAHADAHRYRWLRGHKCNSLHLSRDGDHACNYMTASDWIDNNPKWFRDTDAAELAKMRETNTIWDLQIYPHTPVGFNVWYAATLDSAVDAAMKDDHDGP